MKIGDVEVEFDNDEFMVDPSLWNDEVAGAIAGAIAGEEGIEEMTEDHWKLVKFFPLSLSAAAGVFHAAGESWTISSKFYDVTNYGLFSGDDRSAGEITRQAVEEAVRLGAKEIILSECGHGFRSFRWEGPNWMRKEYSIPVRSVLDVLLEYIEEGRIKVDPSKNTGNRSAVLTDRRTLTYRF